MTLRNRSLINSLTFDTNRETEISFSIILFQVVEDLEVVGNLKPLFNHEEVDHAAPNTAGPFTIYTIFQNIPKPSCVGIGLCKLFAVQIELNTE